MPVHTRVRVKRDQNIVKATYNRIKPLQRRRTGAHHSKSSGLKSLMANVRTRLQRFGRHHTRNSLAPHTHHANTHAARSTQEREREKERESTRARAREYNSRPTPWQLFSLCVCARARGRQTERRRERDRQRDLAKRQPLTGTAVDLENVDLTPRALRPHHPFAVLWLCVCGLESHVYKSLRLAQYASRFVVYDTR